MRPPVALDHTLWGAFIPSVFAVAPWFLIIISLAPATFYANYQLECLVGFVILAMACGWALGCFAAASESVFDEQFTAEGEEETAITQEWYDYLAWISPNGTLIGFQYLDHLRSNLYLILTAKLAIKYCAWGLLVLQAIYHYRHFNFKGLIDNTLVLNDLIYIVLAMGVFWISSMVLLVDCARALESLARAVHYKMNMTRLQFNKRLREHKHKFQLNPALSIQNSSMHNSNDLN